VFVAAGVSVMETVEEFNICWSAFPPVIGWDRAVAAEFEVLQGE